MSLKKIIISFFVLAAFGVNAQNKIIINTDLGKETLKKIDPLIESAEKNITKNLRENTKM